MNRASLQRQFLSQLEVLDQNFGFFFIYRAFILVSDVWGSFLFEKNDQGAWVRSFKTADVFVGANRRAGCKYSFESLWCVWTVVRIVLILTFGTSRCYFEDYTYVFSSERFPNVLRFGRDTAVDKNLMFVEIFA